MIRGRYVLPNWHSQAPAAWGSVGLIAAAAAACGFSSGAAPSNAMALIKQLREKSGAPITDVKACLAASSWDVDAAYDALRRKGLAAAAKKAGRHAAEGLVGLAVDPSSGAAAIVEVNSETDFVARNDLFQGLVSQAAAALLSSARSSSASSSSGVSTLDEQQLSALPCGSSDLASRVAEVGAAVREAVRLRRGFLVTTPPGGVLGSYCHQPVAPGLGRIAALVVLQSDGKEAAAGDMQGAAQLASNCALHAAGMRPLYTSPDAIPTEALAAEREVLAAAASGSGKPTAVVDKMVAGRLKKWYQEVCLLEQPYLLDDTTTVGRLLESQGRQLVGAPLGVATLLRVQVGEGLGASSSPDWAAEVSAMAGSS